MHSVTLPNSFPNLPESIVKIQAMFNRDDVDFATLVEFLQEEPILCANILKMVNSPFYGMNKQVTSIFQAVTLLGTTIIRGIVMATLLKKSFPLNLSPYEISIEEFDKISLLRVRLLTLWLKDDFFDFQFLASLTFLMECGKIVLAQSIVELQLTEEFQELKAKNGLLEAEYILFNDESYHVASKLFQAWMFEQKFTDRLQHIISPQTDEERVLHILATIIRVDAIFDEADVEYAYGVVEECGLNLNQFKKSLQRIKKESLASF